MTALEKYLSDVATVCRVIKGVSITTESWAKRSLGWIDRGALFGNTWP